MYAEIIYDIFLTKNSAREFTLLPMCIGWFVSTVGVVTDDDWVSRD